LHTAANGRQINFLAVIAEFIPAQQWKKPAHAGSFQLGEDRRTTKQLKRCSDSRAPRFRTGS
jgi:hypothetical protein